MQESLRAAQDREAALRAEVEQLRSTQSSDLAALRAENAVLRQQTGVRDSELASVKAELEARKREHKKLASLTKQLAQSFESE